MLTLRRWVGWYGVKERFKRTLGSGFWTTLARGYGDTPAAPADACGSGQLGSKPHKRANLFGLLPLVGDG